MRAIWPDVQMVNLAARNWRWRYVLLHFLTGLQTTNALGESLNENLGGVGGRDEKDMVAHGKQYSRNKVRQEKSR